MATINIVTTDGEELAFELTKPKLTIGREDDNDIVIPDASMSSHHAELVTSGGVYTLTDLGSTNGTQVNGQRIESTPLSDGDVLTLGHANGRFSDGISAAVESAGSPPPPARSAAAPASRSKTPGSFSNSSPFTKKEKVKDPGGQGLMAVGVIGILACVAAIALSLIMRAS